MEVKSLGEVAMDAYITTARPMPHKAAQTKAKRRIDVPEKEARTPRGPEHVCRQLA
jgi:hypothetical protein